MKAEDVPFTQLLAGPKQFIVPVFQRDYSWTEKHCVQLWNDILRVGADPKAKAHFIGSVVYIAAEDNAATISRWLLIDGQQRMTTVTLILTALRDRLPKDGESTPSNHHEVPPRAAMNDYYLRNTYAPSDRRHKLQLRRSDYEALAALLDERELPVAPSPRIVENFEFFREKLDDADLNVVYGGGVLLNLKRREDIPGAIHLIRQAYNGVSE